MKDKIFIRTESKIHRKILDSFKEEYNIKTDTKAILLILEKYKLQKTDINILNNQLKTTLIKLDKLSKKD